MTYTCCILGVLCYTSIKVTCNKIATKNINTNYIPLLTSVLTLVFYPRVFVLN